MKTVLAISCGVTLAAVLFLGVSLAILQPPRASFGQWFLFLALCAIPTIVTLIGLGHSRLTDARRSGLVTAGLLIVGWGAYTVLETLRSAHFEGYALLLGAMLLLQGVLTLLVFRRRPASGAARALHTV